MVSAAARTIPLHQVIKKELLPRINDTHGIGIVLLAGVELRNLEPGESA